MTVWQLDRMAWSHEVIEWSRVLPRHQPQPLLKPWSPATNAIPWKFDGWATDFLEIPPSETGWDLRLVWSNENLCTKKPPSQHLHRHQHLGRLLVKTRKLLEKETKNNLELDRTIIRHVLIIPSSTLSTASFLPHARMISISNQPMHVWIEGSQTIQATVTRPSLLSLFSAPSWKEVQPPQFQAQLTLLCIFLIVQMVHPFLGAKIMQSTALQWLELLILFLRVLHIFLFPVFCPRSKPKYRQNWKEKWHHSTGQDAMIS